jgi:cytochrome P450 family 6
MQMQIPSFGISRDEKYFPDPLKFDPDRFNAENIQKIPSGCLLAFGAGPHNCIGERLALIEVRILIISILMNYRLEMTEGTPKEITFDKNALALCSVEEIILKFVKDPIF